MESCWKFPLTGPLTMPITLAVPLDRPEVRVLSSRMEEDDTLLIEVESTQPFQGCRFHTS
ncbi:hypothetical protein BN874_2090004 [Candidatus Contendobacter odensis Run_B_J11]|uniref:Uncharacterized protein n=1 Tax=Candidatus Contendobacter odensis Run_B_J11 TaxID=1400861 RepID=A0A7U7GBM9_9GAMM|nr:hypothetical protein BN874_2090004 [Candidatus Contendobacter odensis Run_B_J11]